MTPRKWAWLIAAVLVVLSAVPLVAGLVVGGDFGQPSIPTAATLWWQAAIGALIIAFLAATAIHIDKKREIEALLVLAANDVTHTSERVVQYEDQRAKPEMSKSKLQPALDWAAICRLCSLVKDQRFAGDLYCFYEKVWRAEDSFGRASKAAFDQEELAFAVNALLRGAATEPGAIAKCDDSEKQIFLDEQNTYFRQAAIRLHAKVVGRQAAALIDRETGLAFMRSVTQRDPFDAAVSIVEYAAKRLRKTDEWHLLERIREASKKHKAFAEANLQARGTEPDSKTMKT